MPMESRTLRPGLLVSLKTAIKGNVSHKIKIIEGEHITDDGALRSKKEITTKVADPQEHEKAKKARSKARNLITNVCVPSAFGLMCLSEREDKLNKAITEARQVAREFNNTATLSNVQVYVITGRVAQDDVEAVRAINSEILDLIDKMQEGVKNIDVKVIREAALQAKKVGTLLPTDAAERVQKAITLARETANKIVKAGNAAAQEIDQQAIKNLTAARTAFLDLDDKPMEIAKPKAKARVVDHSETPPKTERVRIPKRKVREEEVNA